jgi:FAD/FMN-containing dehydrogenase
MRTIDDERFRAPFHGQVFEPADAGCDDARGIRNASVHKQPPLIARCSGLADAIAAPNFAHRNLAWDIIFGAQSTDPFERARGHEWARRPEEMLRPWSASAHMASALDMEAQEIVDTAFGANLPRLRAIKRKYDPDNFFHVNYNIRPASALAGAA